MPTPFMHLLAAEQTMASALLEPQARTQLAANFSAFFYGNVAPDFQIVSSVPREASHFYGLPPHPDEDAIDNMFRSYPALGRPRHLPVAQAAFIAGYGAHLLLDLVWHRQVLQPAFMHADCWDSNRQRYLVHNTLLTYLDRVAIESLPADAAAKLASADPNGWLPFAADHDLRKWRDYLAAQLAPEGSVRTVEVFARRLGMPAADFAALLQDRDWLEQHLFARVSMAMVRAALNESISASARFISRYLP